MKLWSNFVLVAAVLGFSISATSVDAGVAGKTYAVQGVTTEFALIDEEFVFDETDGVTAAIASGEFNHIFDLGFLSLFRMELVLAENEEISAGFIGIQIGSFFLSRGTDSDDVGYSLFGSEINQTSN